MKKNLRLIILALITIGCVGGAVHLATTNVSGWGWFVFVGIISLIGILDD